MIIETNPDRPSKSPAPRKWRVRFGLGTILLLTTLLCGVLGVWSYYVQPYRNTAMLRQRITELDGFYATNPAEGPQWQVDLVEYLVGGGAFVDLIEVDLQSKTINDDDVRLIGQMRSLQRLNLDRTELTDDGALMLATLSDLVELSVRYTQITDRGASALVTAPKLKEIYWTGCMVTDRTLEAISEDTNLQEVFARWSEVTEEGANRAEQRLVNCQVHCRTMTSREG